jgi:hypothetical protein
MQELCCNASSANAALPGPRSDRCTRQAELLGKERRVIPDRVACDQSSIAISAMTLAAADEGVGCGDAYAFDGIAVLLFLKRGR